MKTSLNFRNILKLFFQLLGAGLVFVASLMIGNLISPLSTEIMEASKNASGFLSPPAAFLFNAAANAIILVWAGRRSSFKGLGMAAQLFALSFGAQVLMTQIETAYFLSAFPLLQNNFQLYNLILRGFITSLIFSLLVTWIVGGFSKKPRPQAAFSVTEHSVIQHGAWLPLIYIVLYMIFGYFVAWQLKEVRLFYGGPAELNGFFDQWGRSLMGKPELPAFQYFRGILWILCLLPLFKGFSGKRIELVILSGLALALLPTAQLALANPLIPAMVSLGHFWEVLISTGIYGMLCAWWVPQPVRMGAVAEEQPSPSFKGLVEAPKTTELNP